MSTLSRRLLTLALSPALLIGHCCVERAFGAPYGAPAELTPPLGAPSDQFGNTVAIDGDTAVVCAALADSGGVLNNGALFVYRWAGAQWMLEAEIRPPAGQSADSYNSAVAIDGATLVVGGRFSDGVGDNDEGAAYVFVRSGATWSLQSKLVANDGVSGDRFGTSVAIDGDTIVVGANEADGPAGAMQGAAYVFTRDGSTWTQEAKLLSAPAVANDRFGHAVGIERDRIIVGANLADTASAAGAGAAYIFSRTGASWSLDATLEASDASSNDALGSAVAIEGARAAVGASRGDNGPLTDRGAVYVFTYDGLAWNETAKLVASVSGSGDKLGESVALSGDTILAGASDHDGDAGSNQGAAFVFEYASGAWSQAAMLEYTTPGVNDNLGADVALDGEFAIAGAPGRSDVVSAGGALIVTRLGGVWQGDDVRMFASGGASGDLFGISVAMDGDLFVSGAPQATGGAGANQGFVYAYQRRGSRLVEVDVVQASDPSAEAYFGYRLAMDGDTMVAASPFANTGQGAAYVYIWDGQEWDFQAKITASDGASNDQFGWTVDISGDTIVVGANLHDAGGFTNAGAAYVFERTGSIWNETQKLEYAEGDRSIVFGATVGVSDDTIVVGSPFILNDSMEMEGRAVVYVRDGGAWTEQAELAASDPVVDQRFAEGVSIHGDTLAVGRTGKAFASIVPGSVYIYERTNGLWTEAQRIDAPGGAMNTGFGAVMPIDGDRMAVGSPQANVGAALQVGAVDIYVRLDGEWSHRGRFAPDDGQGGDFYGAGLDLSAESIGVGSVGADGSGGIDQGAMVMYSIADERLDDFARNTTTNTDAATLGDAIDQASSGQRITTTPTAFASAALTDLQGKQLRLTSTRGVRQSFLDALTLTDGAIVEAGDGESTQIFGDLTVPAGVGATVRGMSIDIGAGADVTIFQNGALSALASATTVSGQLTALGESAVSFAGDVTIDGRLNLLGGTVTASSLSVARGGRFAGEGDVLANVFNAEAFITTNDTVLAGDLTNRDSGTVTVQIGTLTLLGDLVNDGVLLGDLQTLLRGVGTMPGDGLTIGGDYRAGASSALAMPDDVWRMTVGGDYDIAIADNGAYDMASAELRITGATSSAVERMSVDVGASPDGLDRTQSGHFPIGALRLTGGVTTLVDNHDNDGLGQGACEALYVSTLTIDAGATLVTNGCPVYYETLVLHGSVDDPANLHEISACIADLSGDGAVDGMDLAALLAGWGQPDNVADFNSDGVVDGFDLAALLASWGPCD